MRILVALLTALAAYGAAWGIPSDLALWYESPVAIYMREPPGGACGVSYGQFVLVHPEPGLLGCSHTLEHELGHVWQWRGWGLLPLYFELPEPWHQVPPAPRVMRHGLLRLSIPLR